jgi:hypothetical protein
MKDTPMSIKSILRTVFALGLSLTALASIQAADAPKSWTGTWNNNKFRTTGALTCTVIGEQNGQWIARFTGTGLGRPFTYVAYVTPKGAGGTTNLTGTTKVDGDTYQWTGSASAQAMTGSFRSGTGNNGDFRLQAQAQARTAPSAPKAGPPPPKKQ